MVAPAEEGPDNPATVAHGTLEFVDLSLDPLPIGVIHRAVELLTEMAELRPLSRSRVHDAGHEDSMTCPATMWGSAGVVQGQNSTLPRSSCRFESGHPLPA